MPSFPCVDPGRSCARRALVPAVIGLACLAVAGCLVVPVPLPGIKSGRDVDETTAEQIVVGTPMADVLLRLGEPDSVSADGSKFAYRFSRTWGAVLWAIGGAGAAQGGAVPVQFGEAVVIEFDGGSRVVLAERRAGDWMNARPEEEPLFYRTDYVAALRLGGEPVTGHCRVLWWLGRRPNDPSADRRPVGLPPWTAGLYGTRELTEAGNLFVTASALWIRPAFATGTASTDYVRIPRDSIEAVIPVERGTSNEQALLLTTDGRALALQAPPVPGKPATPSITSWITDHGAASPAPPNSAPQEGWVVWVSTKAAKDRPRPPVHFSCLWLTPSGLRFEHFEIDGTPAGSEFLDWTAIERVDPGSRHRTIIGVKIASTDIVCRDGRTLCIAQATPVADRARLAETLRSGWQRGQPAP